MEQNKSRIFSTTVVEDDNNCEEAIVDDKDRVVHTEAPHGELGADVTGPVYAEDGDEEVEGEDEEEETDEEGEGETEEEDTEEEEEGKVKRIWVLYWTQTKVLLFMP